jgi:hypothetical protein
MPRLGVPADITEVRGVFEQPGPALNPLALKFREAVHVRAVRGELGGHSFAAYWYLTPAGGRAQGQLAPKDSLIPVLRAVERLFERQTGAWAAYDGRGEHQPLIDREIERQLAEAARRFPCNHALFELTSETRPKKRAQTRYTRTAGVG